MIMIILLFIICVLNIIVVFRTFEDDSAWLSGISSLIALIALVGCIALQKTPSAMDVYQGKTTLQNVYVDSIRVDSTVVYKNSFYETH